MRSTGRETGSSSAFSRAREAVVAAAELQQALAREPWPPEGVLRLRMGIHTGEPDLGDEGYVGMDVVIAARICAAGHGDQIVVSRATHNVSGDEPFPGGSFKPLGRHRLKDVPAAEQLFQLAGPGLPDAFPPLRTLGERRSRHCTIASSAEAPTSSRSGVSSRAPRFGS